MIKLLVGAVVAVLSLPVSAFAADCGPPQLLASIDMVPVPGGARMLVPATINGVSMNLLLGTAGGLTTLNFATAQAHDLGLRDTDSRLLDSAGNVSRRYVHVDSLQTGNIHTGAHDFMITPDRDAGGSPPNDGVFDATLAHRFDVEMDFAAHRLNYFSPNHCDGHVIYWPAAAVGTVPLAIRARTDDSVRHGGAESPMAVLTPLKPLGQSNLPPPPQGIAQLDPEMQRNHAGIAGSDVQIHVSLDGTDFVANIDTALEQSTLNTATARAVFDVTAESPGSSPAGSIDSGQNGKTGASETVTVNGTRIFQHKFHILSFGDVTITDPRFLVRPDDTGARDSENTLVTDSHVFHLDDHVMPDISIGMDVLSKLHLYFAFGEHKLYATGAAVSSAPVTR